MVLAMIAASSHNTKSYRRAACNRVYASRGAFVDDWVGVLA